MTAPPTTLDLPHLCQRVVALCQETAGFLRREAATFRLDRVEYKGLHDLVSYVDKEAEKMLVSGLRTLLPRAAFITEEGTAVGLPTTDNPQNLRWVIDPLDGTTNFIHRLPVFAISVALMAGDEPLVGVVYEVTSNECFSSWQGGGAYCNGAPIRVSAAPTLGDSLLATGFPYYEFAQMDAYLRVLDELMRKTHGLRRLGSAAIDLAFVACGRFDGYFEYNLKPWDVAAGVLLVAEAGGKVTTFDGGPDAVFGKQLVAGNPPVHAALLSIIQSHWT